MKITIPAADVASSAQFPLGWSKVDIVEAKSETSKKGNSLNHIPTFRLEGTDLTIRTWFNTQVMNKMVPFLAALQNIPVQAFIAKYKDTGIPEFEFEDVKSKKLQIKVEESVGDDGKLRRNVVDYLPYDATTKSPF